MRPGKLIGREPQVQEHALDRGDAQLVQHLAHRAIRRVNQRHGQAGGGLFGQGQHGRVAVQSNDPAGRPDGFCQGRGMAPCPHGAIHQDGPFDGPQPCRHLIEQNGAMHDSTRFAPAFVSHSVFVSHSHLTVTPGASAIAMP